MVIYNIIDNSTLPISHLTSKQFIRQMINFLKCKNVPSHFDCGHNMLPPLSSEYVNTILTQRFLANSCWGVPGFFFYYLEVYVLSTDGGKVRFHLSPFYNISRNCHNNICAFLRLLLHLIRQALTAAANRTLLKFLMQIVSLALFIAVVMENALVY